MEIAAYGATVIFLIWILNRFWEVKKENKNLKAKLETQGRQIRHLIKP